MSNRTDIFSSGSKLLTCVAAFVLSTVFVPTTLHAQQGQYHQPLNQHTRTGKAAAWFNYIRQYDASWVQPVRVELPGDGEVAVYSASPQPSEVLASPAQFSVNAGHVYRLRITNMPDFPGVELYPTIEILDRLHPPAGQENEFPVPIPFSKDDLQLALDGQLVTRVIYLEQPQLAQQLDPLRREMPQSVAPSMNALHQADRLGRPMVIVRIGGRRPAANTTSAAFFGTGGAVKVSKPESGPGMVRLNNLRPGNNDRSIVKR